MYDCEETPPLLPICVCDRYLVAWVCRQYKAWSIMFDRKRKNQFISLPFHVANTTVRNSAHLMEMSEIITPFDLKEGELLRGFDPEGLFSNTCHP
jgi:hypothetical protein